MVKNTFILGVFVATFSLFNVAITNINSITAHAVTYVVDSTGDESDTNTSDSVCNTSLGTCTLRAAIEQATATSANDNIHFNIPGPGPHIINTTTGFADINEYMTINGSTQPGFTNTPLIEIRGNGTGIAFDTTIETNNIDKRLTIIGLSIGGFDEAIRTNRINIDYSYIGLEPDGTTVNSNNIGINIPDTELNKSISIFRTAISGNISHGLFAEHTTREVGTGRGTRTVTDYGLAIRDSFFGTDITGNLPRGNGGDGAHIKGFDGDGFSTDHEIGCIPSSAGGGLSLSSILTNGNVFADNGGNGLEIRDGYNYFVECNHFGIGADGTTSMPNGQYGLENYAMEEIIIQNNVVSNNFLDGIYIYNNQDTDIINNLIGTDSNGLLDRGNGRHGVYIDIGFAAPGDFANANFQVSGNVISGNGQNGFMLQDIGGYTLTDNIIGLGVDAQTVIPNLKNGICLNNSSLNTIGIGSVNGLNTISGNGENGVNIMEGSSQIELNGNYIGTNENGDSGLGNNGHGVNIIENSIDNTISDDSSNNIAYNTGHGINIDDTSEAIIYRTSTSNNGGLGINLVSSEENEFAINTNDYLDGDEGPNELLNMPTITEVSLNNDSNELTISGYYFGVAETTYNIDFYYNVPSFDALTDREIETYVNSNVITTDIEGFTEFEFTSTPSSGPTFDSQITDNVFMAVVRNPDVTSEIGTELLGQAEITIDSDQDEVEDGDTIVYTVTTQNNTTSDLADSQVDVVLDDRLTITGIECTRCDALLQRDIDNFNLDFINDSSSSSPNSLQIFNTGDTNSFPLSFFAAGSSFDFQITTTLNSGGDTSGLLADAVVQGIFGSNNDNNDVPIVTSAGDGDEGTGGEVIPGLIRTGGYSE